MDYLPVSDIDIKHFPKALSFSFIFRVGVNLGVLYCANRYRYPCQMMPCLGIVWTTHVGELGIPNTGSRAYITPSSCQNLGHQKPPRMFKATLLLLGSLISVTVASPIESRALPSGQVTCGTNVYSVAKVVAAVSNGVSHLKSPIGSDSYPHAFSNFEGLEMWCTGKTAFNEFPILTSGLYSGGSPGADRVVFSSDGVYCAVITHTGAGGNNFLSCKGD